MFRSAKEPTLAVLNRLNNIGRILRKKLDNQAGDRKGHEKNWTLFW
jgi:hypothetical protein